MNLKKEILDEFKKVPSEIRTQLTEQKENDQNYYMYSGYQLCLIKTLNLLVDSKLKDNEIIGLLQKHFDMRLSEAEKMLEMARNRKAKDEKTK